MDQSNRTAESPPFGTGVLPAGDRCLIVILGDTTVSELRHFDSELLPTSDSYQIILHFICYCATSFEAIY